MAPPAIAVFYTAELLEMILIQLGPHACTDKARNRRKNRLDKIRRVNKTFQQTIDGSVHIQRLRFLAHATTLELAKDGYPVMNPLLETLITKMGAGISSYIYYSLIGKPTLLTIHIRMIWHYMEEEGYERLPDLEDDSWRQLKVTASKLHTQVALERGNEERWLGSYKRFSLASELDDHLNKEPGDFGALFDIIDHACGNCSYHEDDDDDDDECEQVIARAAVDQVFHTPELLEMILLQTRAGPYQTDVNSADNHVKAFCELRSVNRRFKETIEGSPRLRRAMFRDFSPTLELDDHDFPIMNPYLDTITWKMGKSEVEGAYYGMQSPYNPTELVLHFECYYDKSDPAIPELDNELRRQLKLTASEVPVRLVIIGRNGDPFEETEDVHLIEAQQNSIGTFVDLIRRV